MPKLPRITGDEMVRFLKRYGLQVTRISGSHHFMDGRGVRTSVPVHRGRQLKVGTLAQILRDVELTPEQFATLYRTL